VFSINGLNNLMQVVSKKKQIPMMVMVQLQRKDKRLESNERKEYDMDEGEDIYTGP